VNELDHACQTWDPHVTRAEGQQGLLDQIEAMLCLYYLPAKHYQITFEMEL